jgi:hypothetical protein
LRIGVRIVGRGIKTAILLDRQFNPHFFDLSTGFAGEVVQKCVNYGLRIAVIGGDRQHWSTHFSAFADESTRHGRFIFAASVAEAKARFGTS